MYVCEVLFLASEQFSKRIYHQLKLLFREGL